LEAGAFAPQTKENKKSESENKNKKEWCDLFISLIFWLVFLSRYRK
tara:strand:- start:257 stop:394 length:138 start_codon:yes stop_codon:yes gene_type:complete